MSFLFFDVQSGLSTFLTGFLLMTVPATAQDLTGASDLSLVQSWSQEPNGCLFGPPIRR